MNVGIFLAVPAGAEVTAPLLSIGALTTATVVQTTNKKGRFVCISTFLMDRDV